MEAKEYLGQVKLLSDKVAACRRRIEELQAYTERVGAMRFDNTKVRSSGGDGSALDVLLDSIDGKIREEEEYIRILGEKINEISLVIAHIENGDAALLLTLRYIKFMRMADIAQVMGFSDRYVRKLHVKALTLVHVPADSAAA